MKSGSAARVNERVRNTVSKTASDFNRCISIVISLPNGTSTFSRLMQMRDWQNIAPRTRMEQDNGTIKSRTQRIGRPGDISFSSKRLVLVLAAAATAEGDALSGADE